MQKSTFNQLKFGDVRKKAWWKALGISIKKGRIYIAADGSKIICSYVCI